MEVAMAITPEDQQYFERRSKEERERAANSGDNAAALAHLKLAEAYERRVAKER
jgi:hypothetical protein